MKKKKEWRCEIISQPQQVLWKNNAWAQANRNSLIHSTAGLWSMTLFSFTWCPINVVYVLRKKQIIVSLKNKEMEFLIIVFLVRIGFHLAEEEQRSWTYL